MKHAIVCTCGGSLPRRRVGFVLEIMERSPVGAGCVILRDQAGQRTGVRLACGRCPRDKQLTWANWRKLVAGLDAAGVSTLDISALPF